MQKVCIVPFTQKEYSLAVNLPNDEFTISHLVSPKGVAREGADIGILKDTFPAGLIITNSLEDSIANADLVVISNTDTKPLERYAFQALRCAAEHGKKIKCYLQIPSEKKSEIEALCKNSGAICEYSKTDSADIFFDKTSTSLHEFSVPIIYVEEIFSNCDGYDAFLKIATSLRQRGYNVLAISENPYNTLFNFEYVKLDTERTMKEQIYYLNELVYHLISNYHPDVVVIQPPYPVSKFDRARIFDGGLTAYAISQAVPGDCSLLCSLPIMQSDDSWINLCSDLGIKQGFPVIGVHLCNLILDQDERNATAVVHYPIEQCLSEVDNLNNHSEIPFYNLARTDDLMRLVDGIIAQYVNLPYGVI